TGGQLGLPAPDGAGGPGTGMSPYEGFEPDPNIKMLTGNEFAPEFEEVDSDIKRTPGEYVKDTLNKAKEAYAKGGTAADFV
ncbi:hypothetical protein, partial [Helicobacter pylori]|uniref:hypothetical protein n=1 Tax=Helicobacter pylori TaxID=210 RepID=UPI0029297580